MSYSDLDPQYKQMVRELIIGAFATDGAKIRAAIKNVDLENVPVVYSPVTPHKAYTLEDLFAIVADEVQKLSKNLSKDDTKSGSVPYVSKAPKSPKSSSARSDSIPRQDAMKEAENEKIEKYAQHQIPLFVDEDSVKQWVEMKKKQGVNIDLPRHIDKAQSGGKTARNAFIEKVRTFIKETPTSEQLYLLNAIQRKTPFNLLAPNVLLKKGNVPMHGIAELMKLVCGDLEKRKFVKYIKNGRSTKMGVHPLRDARIEYPLPPVNASKEMAEMIKQSRMFHAMQMRSVLGIYNDTYDGYFVKKNIAPTMAYAQLVKILMKIADYYTKRLNPVELSKYVAGQSRPMAKYRRDNFLELLYSMSTKHRMHPAGKGHRPPAKTGLKISSDAGDEINEFMVNSALQSQRESQRESHREGHEGKHKKHRRVRTKRS